MAKSDYKNALINLNNAQLLKEQEIKVNVKRIECYLKMGSERRVLEEIEGIKHLVSEMNSLPEGWTKYVKLLFSKCMDHHNFGKS